MKRKRSVEEERFDTLMDQLLKVPHSEVQRRMNTAKRAKARKKQAKPASSARASRDTSKG